MQSLDQYKDAIASLCRQYRVRKLYVFGSFVRGEDVAPGSDIDLAVIFDRTEVEGSFDRYMELKSALEILFGRSVDLVGLNNLRNRFFVQELDRTKELVYAA